jgi:hypothetical protein
MELDLSGRLADEPVHDLEERRLAAAARAEQADERAVGDIEVNVLERDERLLARSTRAVAIFHANAASGEREVLRHRHSGASSRLGRQRWK